MRKKRLDISDLEICRRKIEATLKEYNCELMSADEWHHVLIYDKDTNKTLGIGGNVDEYL